MTGTVEVNLKPCPFCGGRATLVYDNQEGYQIYCDDCKIMTPENFDKEKIVGMWNRRV